MVFANTGISRFIQSISMLAWVASMGVPSSHMSRFPILQYIIGNNIIYSIPWYSELVKQAESQEPHSVTHTSTQDNGTVPHVNLGLGAFSFLGLLIQPLGQVLDVGVHLDHPDVVWCGCGCGGKVKMVKGDSGLSYCVSCCVVWFTQKRLYICLVWFASLWVQWKRW